MARQRHDAAFIVGGLLGGMVGAVVTLLNAPQAGARTRALLGETLQPAREGLSAAGNRVASESREMSERTTAALATLSAALPGAGHDEPDARPEVDFAALAGEAPSRPADDVAVPPLPDPLESPPVFPRDPMPLGDDRVIDASPRRQGDAPQD